MGRVDELRAKHAVELAEAEADVRVQALKAAGDTDSKEYREAKLAHRAARQQSRILRDNAPLEVAAGDAVARPEPVKASAKAKSPGGRG